MKRKIYLAGGWFTPEMEEEHTRIYNSIKDKFDVFNPKLESKITANTTDNDMNATLLGNIKGIKDADLVLVIYDRKDTGTIWEAGCAYALNKPILYYAETLGNKAFNLMLARTGSFAANMQELEEKLNESDVFKFKAIKADFKGEIE